MRKVSGKYLFYLHIYGPTHMNQLIIYTRGKSCKACTHTYEYTHTHTSIDIHTRMNKKLHAQKEGFRKTVEMRREGARKKV